MKKTTEARIQNNVFLEERLFTRAVEAKAKIIIDGIKVARQSGASDYQIVQSLIPQLKQLGCMADVASCQISSHDNLKVFAVRHDINLPEPERKKD